MQKTIFLPAISTAVRSPTHTIAPHSGLDLYPVSESACLHLQGASKLKAPLRSAGGQRDFPKGVTEGADRQALSSSAGVTQATHRRWSLSSSSSQPSTVAQTRFQRLLEGRRLTSYQCKPLSYWGGTGHTTEAAASPNGAAGLTRGQPGQQTNL